MWTLLSKFILRNRILLLILLCTSTAFMGWKASHLQFSYELARVLPQDDPAYREYEHFKKIFGEDGSVMVIGTEDKNIFELAKFNDWYDLGQEIKKLDGIEEVISVARIYNITRNDSLEQFDFKPLVSRKPATQQEVDSLKEIIFRLPFYEGLILNKETGATVMAVTFDKNKLNTANRIELVEYIRKQAVAFGEKHKLSIHLSGLPYIRTAITAKVAKELELFLFLAIGVSALILLFYFKSAKVVIFSLLVVAIGVVWSMGTVVLLDYKITILTGLIPALIIIIGIPNSILLLNKYHTDFSRHGNKIKALSVTIERIAITTFLANVTTAIGFGVFYFTNSSILMEFGLTAAINVMTTYAISVVFIPVVFSFLQPPSGKHTGHLTAPRITKILDFIDRLVHYRRKTIYVTVIIVCVISFFGMRKITAVGYVVDDLPEDDPVYVDMKFFEKNFGGVLPFEIIIDSKKKGKALAPETIGKIHALQKMIAGYPDFSKPVSIVEAVKFSYQAYKGGNPKYYIKPNTIELGKISSYTSTAKGKEHMFRSFLDTTKQFTRVTVQMADAGSIRMKKLSAELKPRIDSIFNLDSEYKPVPDDEKYEVTLTGNSMMFLKGNDYLLKNLKESLVLALVLISLIMIGLFMSFRMITVSVLPSLIPLLITAGIMGFFGIALKPSTILIFSIAFGIASDGTIYFLTKYRQELKNHQMSISKTVSLAIRETGVSMVYTATVLFCGFFIFTASDFGGTASLGILLSVTLLIAMCSNLILLPAILLSLEKKLTTKAFLQEPLIQIYDEEDDLELDNLEIKKIIAPEAPGS